MRVKANGITFNCEVSGPDNKPWLIFSNSLATNLHMWDPQAEALKNEFRMLRYDQRGHGLTDAPTGRYTFELLRDDVIALMDALNIKRAHWCGVSMGCATGMALVQKYPDRFDRLALCDNPGRSSPATHKGWEERIAVAQKGGMPALLESTMQRWFPLETLKANPPHMDLIRKMILTTPVNGFIGCSAALSDHDFRRSCRPNYRAHTTSYCSARAISPTWTSRRRSRRICVSFFRPDQAALAIAPCWAWRMMPERSP